MRPRLTTLVVLALVACASPTSVHTPPDPPVAFTPGPPAIAGRVIDSSAGAPLAEALVVLHCACLPGSRETLTDREGLFRIGELPPGSYTVQILMDTLDVSKIVELPANAEARVDFSLDLRPAIVVN